MKKGFSLVGIIIALVVVILVGGGGFYWKEMQKEKIEEQDQRTNSSVTSSAPISTNVGVGSTTPAIVWKTYTNIKYGFQFSSPSDFVYEVVDAPYNFISVFMMAVKPDLESLNQNVPCSLSFFCLEIIPDNDIGPPLYPFVTFKKQPSNLIELVAAYTDAGNSGGAFDIKVKDIKTDNGISGIRLQIIPWPKTATGPYLDVYYYFYHDRYFYRFSSTSSGGSVISVNGNQEVIYPGENVAKVVSTFKFIK